MTLWIDSISIKNFFKGLKKRIHLPKQGTQVWSLVWEDFTWGIHAHMPQLLSPHSRAHAPRREKPLQWEAAPAAGTGSQKGPNSSWQRPATRRNQCFKSWTNWATIHLPYSPDLLPTDYHFFKHLDNFLQGKYFYNQQDAENAFQEFVKSQSMDFYAIGINKLISHWQKCVDCSGSYFDW